MRANSEGMFGKAAAVHETPLKWFTSSAGTSGGNFSPKVHASVAEVAATCSGERVDGLRVLGTIAQAATGVFAIVELSDRSEVVGGKPPTCEPEQELRNATARKDK